MLNRIAKKRRKESVKNGGQEANVWGPDELVPFKDRFSAKEILVTWIRPFKMFLTEPIVLVLSLLSGFSDALIFMFIQSFVLVYEQWDFQAFEVVKDQRCPLGGRQAIERAIEPTSALELHEVGLRTTRGRDVDDRLLAFQHEASTEAPVPTLVIDQGPVRDLVRERG